MSVASNFTLDSIKGPERLSLSHFLARFSALLVFNLLFFVQLHKLRVLTRTSTEWTVFGAVFTLWLIISLVSFYLVSRWLVGRWSDFWGTDRPFPRVLKTVFRAALLSPAIGFGLCLATGLLSVIEVLGLDRSSKRRLAVILAAVSAVLCLGLFSRVAMTQKLDQTAQFSLALSQVDSGWTVSPSVTSASQVGLIALTPSLRYILWLGFDAYRSLHAYRLFETSRLQTCRDRVSRSDQQPAACFFDWIENSSRAAQFVSPVFPLLYLSKARSLQVESDRAFAEANAVTTEQRQQFELDRISSELTDSVLAIDHQLRLLEPKSTLMRSRKSLMWPSWFPILIASPEVPLIEFGQEFQMRSLYRKIGPLITMQLQALETYLEQKDLQHMHNHSRLTTQLIELRARLKVLSQDPTGIASSIRD